MGNVEFKPDPFSKKGKKEKEQSKQQKTKPKTNEDKMHKTIDSNQPSKPVNKTVEQKKDKNTSDEKNKRLFRRKPDILESQSNEIKDVIVERTGTDWTRALIFLSAFGIVTIIMMTQMAGEMNPAFILLIWLFGMMAFLPIGLVIGWLFLDPYMRCKVMRRMRGRNFGVVHLVERGGQKIVTRIKDMDDDCIVLGTKLWFITKEGIHYLNKNGEKVFRHEVKPEDIKTLPSNVPSIFLDVETMQPISFGKQMTKTDPQHAGAIILGYINNQIAKNKAFRQSSTILLIIVLGMILINLIITYQLYEWVEDLHKLLPTLKSQMQQLGNLLSEFNVP